jgi:hypothetical protein
VRDHGVDEELAGSGARRPEPLDGRVWPPIEPMSALMTEKVIFMAISPLDDPSGGRCARRPVHQRRDDSPGDKQPAGTS